MQSSRPLSSFATCAGLVLGLGVAPLHADVLSFVGRFNSAVGGAEIVAYDRANQLLLSTVGTGSVEVISLANPASPALVRTIDYTTTFGAPAALSSLSSVAADPVGRGFGVASIIPTANNTTLGKVQFYNPANGATLATLNVGYHPDSVSFSPDGSKLIVVNEGEWVASGPQSPGSISIIDLGGISGLGDFAGLNSSHVATYDFQAGNLGSGVDITGLRRNYTETNANAHLAMEPEYASYRNGKVYVGLQENNALAVFDTATNQWTTVQALAPINQRVDASDNDGGANVNDTIRALPSPDTIGTYTAGGQTYVVTANEGDARPDDGDTMRLAQQGTSGRPAVDAATLAALNLQYGGSALANAALGRLNVSRIDGLDGEGEIATPTVLGSRSFTIYDAAGNQVWDSGSFFEDYIVANDLASWVDGRSDDKGPEPEALTLGEIDGQTYAFIGMERTNGIFMFNISDPTNPVFVDYVTTGVQALGDRAPEGMAFIPAALSPNGRDLLAVSFETSGTISLYEVAIPEPSTYAALAGVGALGLVSWNRRRKR